MNRIEPGPSQESVWDYPRPPRLEKTDKRKKVVIGGVTLAYTTRAKRVLETSHPPVYYIPLEDVRMKHLTLAQGDSICEWKDRARYCDVVSDKREELRTAWFYPEPASPFEDLRDHVAFYPSKMHACWVDGEKVEAQPGDTYGGWITPEIVDAFKGAPGTWGW